MARMVSVKRKQDLSLNLQYDDDSLGLNSKQEA